MDIYVCIDIENLNAVIVDMGMLLSLNAVNSLNSIEKIQSRMMRASFNGNPYTTIISCYCPTYASEETVTITFYYKLYFLVWHIPIHNVLIISGDMNAQIDNDKNNRFCSHNSSNGNGKISRRLYTRKLDKMP